MEIVKSDYSMISEDARRCCKVLFMIVVSMVLQKWAVTVEVWNSLFLKSNYRCFADEKEYSFCSAGMVATMAKRLLLPIDLSMQVYTNHLTIKKYLEKYLNVEHVLIVNAPEIRGNIFLLKL